MPAGDSALELHTEQAGEAGSSIRKDGTVASTRYSQDKASRGCGERPRLGYGLALTDRAYAAGKTGVEGVHR